MFKFLIISLLISLSMASEFSDYLAFYSVDINHRYENENEQKFFTYTKATNFEISEETNLDGFNTLSLDLNYEYKTTKVSNGIARINVKTINLRQT
jgi:hypothetical protein